MKHKIQLSHNRVLLSEVLPYETPLIFTNRYFYRFANYYGLMINENIVSANKHIDDLGLKEFLNLWNIRPDTTSIKPFVYKVNHQVKKWDDLRIKAYKNTDFRKYRDLTLIHPAYQIEFVDFYKKYQTLITYYCCRSNYSIRYPYKKAHLEKNNFNRIGKVFKDSDKKDSYESLKHYFAYKRFNNINSFFDDYSYLKAEKKFNFLLKLDVEKCFESIKITSFSRAIYGEEVISASSGFVKDFIYLMKKIKSQDDNIGIIIGPEFSRIFAEIIFQAIDKTVETKLLNDGIRKNSDYECFRYVDDIYFFFNDIKIKYLFRRLYAEELCYYGLSFNKKKEKVIERPLIDNKFIAKNRIENLINEIFKNQLKELSSDEVYDIINFKISPYKIDYKNVIIQFKSIIKETNVEYKDVMSFTAYKVSKFIDKVIVDFDKLYKKYVEATINDELDEHGIELKKLFRKKLFDFLYSIIQSIFFFIASDFRMSNIHSLVTILDKIIKFAQGSYIVENETIYRFEREEQEDINKLIHDELVFLLKNCDITDNQQVEMSYLLILNKKLGEKFPIQTQVIDKLLINIIKKNYFTYISLLYLFDNIEYYSNQKERLKLDIDSLLNDNLDEIKTEIVYLLTDILCCPFLDVDYKKKLILIFFDSETVNADNLLQFASNQRKLFIKWEDVDIFKESIAKRSQEVY